jgi:murein L,D-transpeptidase YafK
MKQRFLIVFSFCVLLSLQGWAIAHPEQRLLLAVQAVQAAKLDEAESLLYKLIHDEPEFKLAHMIYADIQTAKSAQLQQAGMGLLDRTERQHLLTEVQVRFQAGLKNKDKQVRIPAVLARLDVNYSHAIIIDLQQSRLFVFENNSDYPRHTTDYYVSMGRAGAEKEKEGDLRTPLGVYFVQSHIPSYKLADKYGAGAYPLNYPNAWDVFNGRTGSGIWLHGTRSGTYNRPPLASEGCVVLPNADLLTVGSHISLGLTPVLIGENINWLTLAQWQQQRSQTNAIFQNWINDWQSLNVESYLSHYSQSFNNGKKDFSQWIKHKRRVAKNKNFIKVIASDVSLLMHPNDDVLVVTFRQNYKSNNYTSQSWKRQYWRKEVDGQWRIIFEGGITGPLTQQLVKRNP